MKIGLVQFKPELFQVKDNIERAIKLIENKEADLFVFPELTFTGYTFNTHTEVEWVAEDKNGYSITTFKKIAKEKNTNIVFGFVEKDEGKLYNSSVLIKSTGETRIYRKTHLFYEEKVFFEKGDTGFWVEEVNGVKVGLAICFDWFYPESFRTLALKGAQVIAHSANLVMPYCQEANKFRSLENHVFIVTSNRWGEEINALNTNNFTGMSQITNPKGEVIIRFPEKGDMVKTIEINPEEANNKQLNKLNNIFEDRRPEFYFNG
ncbi:nitrilase [Marinitoga sp. 1135]|uniref:nitrilase-related carbon-nitrogen hydrolase n=1 Tax=Marinitoga sp. 1135 TaxID=1643333 RepID=UPI001586F321|nr:nitrilase-related carbon-nitrogen hydrolase [Marinitoga sp. 1135]NUU96397.1 nitrilase [Marinitoga sp. 1135]